MRRAGSGRSRPSKLGAERQRRPLCSKMSRFLGGGHFVGIAYLRRSRRAATLARSCPRCASPRAQRRPRPPAPGRSRTWPPPRPPGTLPRSARTRTPSETTSLSRRTLQRGFGIAYYAIVRSGNNLVAASKTGGAWSNVIVDGKGAKAPSGDAGIGANLTIDGNGDWNISYVNGHGYSQALQYVKISHGTTVRFRAGDRR